MKRTHPIRNVVCPTMPAGSGRVCGVVIHPITKAAHCMHCSAPVTAEGHHPIADGDF